MKTIPMIFNTEMVKALIDGRKTVTRRPIKDRYFRKLEAEILIKGIGSYQNIRTKDIGLISGFEVGDLIWVRETFCHQPCANAPELTVYRSGYPQAELSRYESIMSESEIKWTPSIHMPRWASRLTLRVTDVRIERVQDITEEKAKKEGVAPAFIDEFGNCPVSPRYKNGFYKIWNSIYSNWDKNPYVWVIEFEVIHKNMDEVGK